ncbi:MAG: hypothetical protein Roseis2KO_29400 [Roseivirga sp.]
MDRLIIVLGVLLLPLSLGAQVTGLNTSLGSGQIKMNYVGGTGVTLSTMTVEEPRIPGLRSSLLRPHKLITFGVAKTTETDTEEEGKLDDELKPRPQYNPANGISYSGQFTKRTIRGSGVANPLLTRYELIDTGEPVTPKEEASAKKLTISVESNLLGERKTMLISGHGLDVLSVGVEISDLTGEKVKLDKSDVSFNKETGQLQLSLLIRQGYYEFKIPTASGTITESLYISW